MSRLFLLSWTWPLSRRLWRIICSNRPSSPSHDDLLQVPLSRQSSALCLETPSSLFRSRLRSVSWMLLLNAFLPPLILFEINSRSFMESPRILCMFSIEMHLRFLLSHWYVSLIDFHRLAIPTDLWPWLLPFSPFCSSSFPCRLLHRPSSSYVCLSLQEKVPNSDVFWLDSLPFGRLGAVEIEPLSFFKRHYRGLSAAMLYDAVFLSLFLGSFTFIWSHMNKVFYSFGSLLPL